MKRRKILDNERIKIFKRSSNARDFIDTVKVNGRTVQYLYDTGTTKAALKQGLEKPEKYNGKFARCNFPNSTSIKYPLANVEVEGE